MGTQVAFLRGINVGGRRVTNERLVEIAEGQGFDNVSAFLASGNLILNSSAHPSVTDGLLSGALEEGLGYEVDVFVRSAAEILAVASVTPFDVDDIAGPGKPQITFLHKHPSPEDWLTVAELGTADDLVELGDRCWFWLPALGISGTSLDVKAVERAVGVGTTRTLNTIARIAKKLG